MMDIFDGTVSRVAESLERVAQLNARYRAGEVHAYVPEALRDSERSLEELVRGASAGFACRARGRLAQPVLLAAGRVRSGRVGRTVPRGRRSRRRRPAVPLSRHGRAHRHAGLRRERSGGRPGDRSSRCRSSRRATRTPNTRPSLSLRLKAELNRIAPAGTPRHFIVNTGAEAVENAIKSVLLNRVMTSPDGDGGFIVSFEGAFHGRTLGSLAVTHRKKARLGFPTFDWPHISVSGRGRRLAQGDAAARGAQPEAAVGSAGVRPAAARREEQGHLPARDGRARRVPRPAGART